jgi:hypothetical protein
MTERYFADGKEFLYPHAGDALAPRDTKVLLLSRGGICTVGFWGDWCLGWLPLPKRNKEKELSEKVQSNTDT